jgi:hypothetical protein
VHWLWAKTQPDKLTESRNGVSLRYGRQESDLA